MEQSNSPRGPWSAAPSAECYEGQHLRCAGAPTCTCTQCDCRAAAAVSNWLAQLTPEELDQERRTAAIALARYFRLAGYGHARVSAAVA